MATQAKVIADDGRSAVDARGSGSLRTYRLNIMRAGYAFMAFGLAVTKWPIILGPAASLPAFEGVVAAMLTAMSLLALLGLRYPLQLLPILIFESAWKLIWLATVALPNLTAGGMSDSLASILFSVALVPVILAATPWDYAWRQLVKAPGDPWR